MTLRHITGAILVATLLYGAPALAVTAKQKMETCKFGADDQQLAGGERKKFISRCMANEPTARAKPTPKPASAPATPAPAR